MDTRTEIGQNLEWKPQSNNIHYTMIMNRCFAIFFLFSRFQFVYFIFRLFSNAMVFCVHVCFILLRFFLFNFLIVRAMHPTINFLLFVPSLSSAFFFFSSNSRTFTFYINFCVFLLQSNFHSYQPLVCTIVFKYWFSFFPFHAHTSIDDFVCVHIQRRQNKTNRWNRKSSTHSKCVYVSLALSNNI